MLDSAQMIAVHALRRLTRILPHASALALGRALGRAVWLLGVRRRVGVENTARALAGTLGSRSRQQVVRRAYEHLGMVAIEVLKLPALSVEARRARVEFEGLEHVQAALERGRGAIIASAHYGNWELLGAGGVAHGLPVTFVVQRLTHARLDAMLCETRQRLGIRVLERGMALRRMRAEIESNRLVAIMCDQDARRRGVFVPFFGIPASTHKGAAQLALRLETPLIPLFGRRLPDGRHRMLVHEPIAPPPHVDEDEAVRQMMARFNTVLEAVIRDEPGQYLWMHRRWKSAPKALHGDASGTREPIPSARKTAGG